MNTASTAPNPMIANNNSTSVSMLPPIGNDSNIAAAQMYQNSGQPPQQQASRATNHYTQQPQQSTISNIQPVSNGLVHSGNPQQQQASSRATTNHYQQQQKQNANSNIPPVSNGLVQQPHPGLKHGSISSEMKNTSGMARPTSSYGRKRPTPVSNVPVNNSGAISAKVAAASGTTGPTAATSTGQQPFHPNNNDNANRRVSLDDQKQLHRQVLPHHNNSQSTNVMNHAPSVVSQTPSTHGGNNHNNTTDNSYVAYSSNHTHKRPPLGAILGPNANGIYSSSESSSSNKRPKQQQQIHHNPYNNQSGRKSI